MGTGAHILAHILVVHAHLSHGMHSGPIFVGFITERNHRKHCHWPHSAAMFVDSLKLPLKRSILVT